jgi:hypothetical protein
MFGSSGDSIQEVETSVGDGVTRTKFIIGGMVACLALFIFALNMGDQPDTGRPALLVGTGPLMALERETTKPAQERASNSASDLPGNASLTEERVLEIIRRAETARNSQILELKDRLSRLEAAASASRQRR